MLSQLERYVITYADDSGKIVCNIPDYYAMRVKPLAGKFATFSFENTKNNMSICPFHDDHDPSLGLIKHKFLPNVMIYHCLGCGSAGTVVRFHQRIEQQYHNRVLSDKEACIELCSIFNIPVPTEDAFEPEDYNKKTLNKYMKIDKLRKRYTEKQFAEALLSYRKNPDGIDLNRVNIECIKMISTMKGLYN